MKLKKIKLLMIFIFSLIGMAIFQNCSDVNVMDYDSQYYMASNTGIDYCTTNGSEIKSSLKFIFVVDRSGSNQMRYDSLGNALPGTDPDGDRRFNAIESFIQNFQEDPLVYWSLINFGTSASIARSFTNDKAGFMTFIQDQHARTKQIDTDGWTNYLSALNSVNTLISNDLQAAAAKVPLISSNYVIFFISDGAPITSTGMQDQNSILNKVNELAALQDKQPELIEALNFHTGFYFSDASPDLVAKSLLLQMSIRGGGDALEFALGQVIDFNRFAIPTRIQRFELREVWIQNLNTVWWGDRLLLDTDKDGLPDKIEETFASGINNEDSDGNGVRDGVEYKLSGKPCRDAQCATAASEPFFSCSALAKQSTSLIQFVDTDRDGLNDCEETALGSDYRLFDTNSDYVPDGFGYDRGIEFLKGSNNILQDTDQDGVSNYYELKYNSPVRVRNSAVLGLRQASMTVTKTEENEMQTCYNIQVSNIGTQGPAVLLNHFRIFIMESTSIVGTKRVMRRADKLVRVNSAISVTRDEFN